MSVRIMAQVWDGYPGGGSDLLALLALADWSDDEGRCWPSIASIGKKTRLSRSQAQRVVHGLIDEGFVSVVGNQEGGAPGSTRQYRINLEALTGRMDATGRASATGSMDAQDGSHGRADTGRMGATQTIIEPSITTKRVAQALPTSPAKTKVQKADITLQAFLEQCRTAGEPAIPEDDPVFAYADKTGITREMLAVAWNEFKASFLPMAKRQKDWRAHFRNAVRRNWYKLWFLKDGETAQWTTAGEQARRVAA